MGQMFVRFEFYFLETALEGLNSQKTKYLERGYIHFNDIFRNFPTISLYWEFDRL